MLSGQVPYSQEAEEALLGAILINPTTFMAICAFLGPEDFYILRHQYIWEALGRLYDRHDEIDYLTLQEELKGMGRLNEIGGPAYLINLINNSPTSMHSEIYGRLVERAAIRRRYLAAADTIKGLAMDEEMAVETVELEATKALRKVSGSHSTSKERPWVQVVSSRMTEVEERVNDPDHLIGLPSGLRSLDEITGGFQKSDLIILAGRPGMGKSSAALTFMFGADRVGAIGKLYSREMSADQIADRALSMESSIDLQQLRLESLEGREWSRYVQAAGRVGTMNFSVNDDISTIEGIRNDALREAHEVGLDYVIIDYLQLLNVSRQPGQRTFGNENEEYTHISRECKNLARDLNRPVIGLAQLNRDLEKREDKRPRLSDLRGSGSWEQDADLVIFLYRDVVYNDDTEFPNRAEFIVAKHRNGPTGVANTHFDKVHTKFSDSHTQTIDLSGL